MSHDGTRLMGARIPRRHAVLYPVVVSAGKDSCNRPLAAFSKGGPALHCLASSRSQVILAATRCVPSCVQNAAPQNLLLWGGGREGVGVGGGGCSATVEDADTKLLHINFFILRANQGRSCLCRGSVVGRIGVFIHCSPLQHTAPLTCTPCDVAPSEFVPFYWGPPRRQGLCSQSAHFGAPEKVGVL